MTTKKPWRAVPALDRPEEWAHPEVLALAREVAQTRDGTEDEVIARMFEFMMSCALYRARADELTAEGVEAMPGTYVAVERALLRDLAARAEAAAGPADAAEGSGETDDARAEAPGESDNDSEDDILTRGGVTTAPRKDPSNKPQNRKIKKVTEKLKAQGALNSGAVGPDEREEALNMLAKLEVETKKQNELKDTKLKLNL